MYISVPIITYEYDSDKESSYERMGLEFQEAAKTRIFPGLLRADHFTLGVEIDRSTTRVILTSGEQIDIALPIEELHMMLESANRANMLMLN